MVSSPAVLRATCLCLWSTVCRLIQCPLVREADSTCVLCGHLPHRYGCPESFTHPPSLQQEVGEKVLATPVKIVNFSNPQNTKISRQVLLKNHQSVLQIRHVSMLIWLNLEAVYHQTILCNWIGNHPACGYLSKNQKLNEIYHDLLCVNI